MKSETQSGNVLFVILIAVALFAALSYAVTSSTRSGGGTVSREQLKLDISTALNALSSINMEILRKSLSGTDPITLTTGPGGVYEPGNGIPVVHPPLSLRDPSYTVPENQFTWVMFEAPFYVTSNHLGSSKPDILVYSCGFSETACREINKDLIGSDTLPTYTKGPPNGVNYENSAVLRDGTSVNAPLTSNSTFLPLYSSACYTLASNPSLRCLYFITLER